MNVGRTDTARDFIDARDGVRAMMILLEKGRPGEPVNICTGRSYTIKETIDLLIKISGLDVTVNSDKSLYRATDEPVLIGDTSKLRALGFLPEFNFEQTLEAVYNNWLDRV
ncbi:GDP-6-deoxy-D-mannose reductase [bioreactor metagenome]|uniref:GDP-6-deoxy-D-mannose reductase n=1 Tax=bioreactor metagenome TaxID=1076179 RepID=A0A645G276_9ZZZZ